MEKKQYRVRNWAEYNRGLVNRGRLDLWISGEVQQGWISDHRTGKRGRQQLYSDIAIQSAFALKTVFRLTYRGAEGLMKSLFALGNLLLPVPCYTQIQKRAKRLALAKGKLSKKRPTDIVIDASGMKVYGEGEWKVHKHGKGRKGKWIKIHIAQDPDTGEIILTDATESDKADCQFLPECVRALPKSVSRLYGDGAYDTKSCYEALMEAGIDPIIPPRQGAVVHSDVPYLRSRNDAVCQILALGGTPEAKALWKKLKSYGRRSLVEATFSRLKRAFGDRLWSRIPIFQEREVVMKLHILNHFRALAWPSSYAV